MTARRDHVFTAHVRTKSMDTSVTVICSTGERPVINVFLYFSLINLTSITEFCFYLQPPTLSLVLLSFRHVVRNIIYRRRNFYIVFLIAPFLTFFWQVTKSSKKSGKRQVYRTNHRYVRYQDHHLFCLILQSFVKILFV